MTQEPLPALAQRHGLALEYIDGMGQRREVPPATLQALVQALGEPVDDTARMLPPVVVMHDDAPAEVAVAWPAEAPTLLAWRLVAEDERRWHGVLTPQSTLPLPAGLPQGYHELTVRQVSGERTVVGRTTVIVCPRRCWQPPAFAEGGRAWLPVLQVYGLASARNAGIGDFADVRAALAQVAALGAQGVGLSPLHALFPHAPAQASPYSPSSRLWVNTLFLALDEIADWHESAAARGRWSEPAFQARWRAARAGTHVDYDAVAPLKDELLGLLYRHFRDRHLAARTRRAREFRAFQREHGASLRSLALFQALQAHLHRADPACWGWPCWPERYQARHSAAVRTFEHEHEAEVEYFEYLQWQAELQLAALAQDAEAQGLWIGLYRDLAVGVSPGGAETWADPSLYALGLRVGAPPDAFSAEGQEWGLPPLHPQRLREAAYAPFIAVLRANMRHAGALRMDHVMGLMRLFVVPAGRPASEGTYLHLRLDETMAILALESCRHRCLIVGEDLGAVPTEIREAMQAYGVLSYQPWYFAQRHDGRYPDPREIPARTLLATGTHDMPPLAAWWSGSDLGLRERLALDTPQALQAMRAARERDRHELLAALERNGLKPAGAHPHGPLDAALIDALHALQARSAARLFVVQPEDVFELHDPVNVPGTSEAQHPNWRVRLPVPLEAWDRDGRWARVAAAVQRERPGSPAGAGTDDALPALASACVPRATYRLQLGPGFGFEAARALLPRLARLGLSHLYLSPVLRARSGSTHGYDIVDHAALNPELGSEAEFFALCRDAHAAGLHVLLDIVPNHMGVLAADNAWWLDVLEHGPSSRYAHWFDIDWCSGDRSLHGKVLMPVLGDAYGAVLEAGDLQLRFDAERGSFAVHYHEHRFPLDPRDVAEVLAPLLGRSGFSRDSGDTASPSRLKPLLQGQPQADTEELQDVIAAFAALPERLPPAQAGQDREHAEARHTLAEVCKARLAALVQRSPEAREAVEHCVLALQGQPGDARSFDALDALIRTQAWRPAFWRVASDEINYRRFFDINALAGLRMEEPEVFEATHRTLFGWILDGHVDGLRLDHPDGLFDPLAYFERLQRRHAELQRERHPERPPTALYVVVEKILAEHERLPAHWPVHGTTGYEFGHLVNALMVDGAQEARFERLYAAFTGLRAPFTEVLDEAKRLIMDDSLAAELHVVTEALHRIAQADRATMDFTRHRLRKALEDVTAAFPVYRTYLDDRPPRPEDRRVLAWALAGARQRATAADHRVFDFLEEVLLSGSDAPAVRRFIGRFQQFTSPVMAKSMEDTAFYRYLRLAALNEVGGEPRRFGLSVAAFHAANQQRARWWPHTLLATSTHDGKRSEDLRARLVVLSEMPGPWRLALQRWRRLNARHKQRVGDEAAPSANDEYLVYQTLLGLWPAGGVHDDDTLAALRERVQAYLLKAVREAKRHTSWVNPDEAYEQALQRFVDALIGQREPNPFLTDFVPLARRLARHGQLNSLAMVLFKLTAPGVPDLYQGCETWSFALVDPDNRRPIDHAALAAALDALPAAQDPALPAWLAQQWQQPDAGALKLHVTARALALRAAQPALWRDGRYLPIAVQGPAAEHLVAYARVLGDEAVVTLAARLPHGLTGGDEQRLCDAALWQGTTIELPAAVLRAWRSRGPAPTLLDALSGRSHGLPADGPWPVQSLLAHQPLALLHAGPSYNG